jgi:hypothetical protein
MTFCPGHLTGAPACSDLHESWANDRFCAKPVPSDSTQYPTPSAQELLPAGGTARTLSDSDLVPSAPETFCPLQGS